MSENQQANTLAEWLAEEPGTSAPPELERDVVEAIYALNPAYAPAMNLSVDDVFDVLSDGPLLDPKVGQALENWINSPPGTSPPDSLPDGVVEATYALRPELAPAPKLAIGDILDSVESGPMVDQQVVELTAPPSRRSWWASPALGAMAVAAMALFFVRPVAHKSSQAPPELPMPVDAAPAAQATETRRTELPVSLKTKEASAAEDMIAKKQVRMPIQPVQSVESGPPPTTMTAPTPQPEATAAIIPVPVPEANSLAEPAKPPPPTFAADADSFSPPTVSQRPAARSIAAAESTQTEEEEQTSSPPETIRSRRANRQLAALDERIQQTIEAAQYTQALATINEALALPNLTRFDTARLWRAKARVLTALGRETEAQHAQQTAANLDPTR